MRVTHELQEAPRALADADFPAAGPPTERLTDLVRYAVLAPSSHNTQPWLFRAADGQIDLVADLTRWLEVADDDRRELYLSLGCALENLVVAAEHFGYGHEVDLVPHPMLDQWVAAVRLHEGGRATRPPELFDAIPLRCTSHRPFTGAPVREEDLRRLAECGAGDEIHLWTSTDPAVRERIARLVARANRIEFADHDFRRELGTWIGRGVFGTPEPFRAAARLAVTHLDLGRHMARKDAALVTGAGALAVVLADADSPRAQLRAGMVLERAWLLGTHLGLAFQPMSGPLQVPELREELGALIGTREKPLHLFRIGYAPPNARRSSRRPVEAVLL